MICGFVKFAAAAVVCLITALMMFDLPIDDALHAALIARDASFDGRAFVGVTSTGVFCRLTCPARKPWRQNCVFFDQIGSCIEAGFLACLRCHPMAQAAQSDPAVAQLLTALKTDPARRWSEGDVQALGLDPSTARRAFKRHFGMTFLEMARLTRLRTGAAVLATGGKVILMRRWRRVMTAPLPFALPLAG